MHRTKADVALLVIRLGLGVIFVAHGGQKLFGWFGGAGLKGTIAWMSGSLHVPAALVVLAAVAEFFGGLGVLTGLLTRVAALGIACVMGVAIATTHWQHGFFNGANGIEFPLMLLVCALALMIGGSGHWGVDRLIRARLLERQE